jgi:transglutaminase-like putative cysteine protease
MRQTMNTDLFIWHGYAEVWLDQRWIKLTPVFNIELCEKFGLLPLDWDGEHDSLYHAYDQAGNRHMEYVNERGSFQDMPVSQIVVDFKRVYAGWEALNDSGVDFDQDVQQELRR